MKKTSRRYGRGHSAAVAVALTCASGCVESVRVPLAVPLPAVAGSRPASPQGFFAGIEFGDGVWGQEQERAEMGGGVLGLSVADRLELSTSVHSSTRTVRDSSGDPHTGETTAGLRAKVRLGDFGGGRASVGLQVATMSADRIRSDVQNDRLTAVDIAVPLEVYPIGGPLVDYRLGVYAAPRLVLQTFDDRRARETTEGTLRAGVVGIVGRWRHFSLSGELNFANTPEMIFGNATFPGGTHVLPVLGMRGIIPFGG